MDAATSASKLNYLFGPTTLAYSDRSLIYVTPHQISKKIAELANDFYGLKAGSMRVLDMFAGVGMDTISLAKYASVVYATEVNSGIFANLRENTQIYPNICSFNCDCRLFIKQDYHVDLVYFDPPWGDCYRSGERFDFSDVYIGDEGNQISVIDLILQIYQKYGNIIIKSPITSETFERLFPDDVVKFSFTRQRLKFLFIRKASDIEHS